MPGSASAERRLRRRRGQPAAQIRVAAPPGGRVGAGRVGAGRVGGGRVGGGRVGGGRVLALTGVGVFVVFLDTTVVNIALPAVQRSFPGATVPELSWILNGYTIVFGAVLMAAGSLADRVGRRRCYVAGLVVFAVSSLGCSLAPDVGVLVGCRAAEACGAALVTPTSLALVLESVPAARRAQQVAVWGAIGALAVAVGPTVGALVIRASSWRWIFVADVVVAGVAAPIARWGLRESRGPATPPVDRASVVLLVAGLGAMTLALVQGEQWGWSSGPTTAAAVASVGFLALLAWRCANRPVTVVPVALLRIGPFRTALAATFLASAAFFANLLCLVLLLADVWRWPMLTTAVAILPAPLCTFVVATLVRRVPARHGFRSLVVTGCALAAAGEASLAVLAGPHPSYLVVLPQLLATGVGIGLAYPTLTAAASQLVPSAAFGAGSAVASTARQVGATVGVAIVVVLIGGRGGRPSVTGCRQALLSLAVEAAFASVVALWLQASPVAEATAPDAAVGPPGRGGLPSCGLPT